ncbi:MAG: cytochrome c biogenesis protein DipZ [Candidatus Pacebacteria bacterium]|nr:cytochrome c biogenesis protein DipZ [Candidatus Paceibacterota bacterium]
MLLLIAFAFIAGIVTILSPCILPVLPFILSGSTSEDKARPWGVVLGFVASFTFFTLFLTTLVKLTGVSADVLRYASITILFLFGLSLIVPQVQLLLEKAFTMVAGKVPNTAASTGLFGGLLVGLSLGLLWTPCVGPILASVISLALTGSVTGGAVLITLSYALGTSIPMLVIMKGGQAILQRNQWLVRNTANIQKGFGVLMMITAFAIFNNYDRKFQSYILEAFPQYGVGLTSFEDSEVIKKELDSIGSESIDDMRGKSLDAVRDKSVKAPEIIPGGEWINSEPFTIKDQQGKVVLIDFWTYSCINCIRTLPYLKSWHEKYASKGLVILGVHAPEFEFEKNINNVRDAVKGFELKYPIVQDNNFETWKAYRNRYWPAKYLIDKNGMVRYTHFGEGKYDETEKMIQKLLSEAGSDISDLDINNPEYELFGRTPEIYLGFKRMQLLASPEKIVPNKFSEYSSPSSLVINKFALESQWKISEEYSEAEKGSSLYSRFSAKDVYLVMRSTNGEGSQVKVFLDGEEIGENGGIDVIDSMITVNEDRLYHIVELDKPGTHTLKLEYQDGNIESFAFTFG